MNIPLQSSSVKREDDTEVNLPTLTSNTFDIHPALVKSSTSSDIIPSRATSLPPLESSSLPASSSISHLNNGRHSADSTPLMSHTKFDSELWAANAITNASASSNTSLPHRSASATPVSSLSKPGSSSPKNEPESSRVSAYARLDFESFTFYVQTLQVILGRRAENGTNMVDVHLGPTKAISRRHAKIFYNFGTQRFELSVLGRNGAFVGDVFVETGSTVPLRDGTKIQIGQIPFTFVLPGGGHQDQATAASAGADEAVADQISLESGADVDQKNVLQMSTFEPLGYHPQSQPPKSPKRGPVKKKEYAPEEIPPEFREKPNQSYSQLIAAAMRAHSPVSGMTLGDIYRAIQELFPYYKYCPSGWQNSVRHNLSSNKAFKKVSKEGKGWLWGIDEEYYQEKERQRQRQQAKPKNVAGSASINGSNGKRTKTIAELAREIEVNKEHQDRLYNPELWSNAADASSTSSAMPPYPDQQMYTNLQQQQQSSQNYSNKPFDTNNIHFEYQAQIQNQFNSAQQKASKSNATSVPGMSTFRTKLPVLPVDHMAVAAATSSTPSGSATSSTSSASAKPQLPLSQDTIKALAHLRKKVLTQMEAMGLPTPNVTVLTNALAVALAQAAKSVPGGVAALLNGKNPTQLTQVLQVALREVMKKSDSSSSVAPPPPQQVQPQSAPAVVAPVPIQPVQATAPLLNVAADAHIPRASQTEGTSASHESTVSPQPVVTTPSAHPPSTQPPSTQPPSTQPPSAQPATAQPPIAQPAVSTQPTQHVAPVESAPSTQSAIKSNEPSLASTAASASSLLTPGEKPNAAQIAQLLAQASKISNPSPSMKAMLDKLRAHLAKSKRPMSPPPSGEQPASKAARID